MTLSEECEQWARLADRLVLGETVTRAQHAFLAQHQADCPSCAREAAAYRELRPAVLHSVPSNEEIERVLELAAVDADAKSASSSSASSSRDDPTFVLKPATHAEGERTASEATTLASTFPMGVARKRRRVLAGAALAAGLCGAALWLMLALPHRSSSALSTARPARTDRTLALPMAGSTISDRAVARAGEDSCGELTPHITLCTTKGTEVDRVELNTLERVLYLNAGRAIASVAHQPSGASFKIVTPAGSVTATGAVFSVEVDENGTTARVSRGAVALRMSASDDGSRPLLAGQMLRLGALESSRLPPEEGSKDRSVLERLGRLSFPD